MIILVIGAERASKGPQQEDETVSEVVVAAAAAAQLVGGGTSGCRSQDVDETVKHSWKGQGRERRLRQMSVDVQTSAETRQHDTYLKS